MADDRKGLLGALLETGARVAASAAGRVLADPRGQEAVARAVGLAQRAKRRAEEVQARVLRAAGIPGREDVQDLAKQLARIKRKARELAEAVEAGRPGARAGTAAAAEREPADPLEREGGEGGRSR
ncbi:MAG TPA: hypothetical protein VLS93_09370 [Anaeromyxobacteraceae bacterium]|nr:hypothetical protein [Anaeromyxobacteraceae bacterium]